MERTEFERQLSRLKSLKKNIDTHLIDAYFLAIGFWPVSELDHCITIVLQEDRIFPKVPRLKEIYSNRHGKQATNTSTGTPSFFSLRCGVCEADVSVNRKNLDINGEQIKCLGNGISSCGRSWDASHLKRLILEAEARSENYVTL
jgi:hypothetical protein